MTTEIIKTRKASNSYNIFILVLTVLSLAIMFVQLLPLSPATKNLLGYYDNLVCVIFLIDFFSNLYSAPRKSDYFLREGGWLDLLGSIPSFGISQYGGLLRLARLGRFARITRLLRGENKAELVKDVLTHRSQYAGFITILLVFLVLTVSSVLVLQFESASPDAKITTGGDALWYAFVTITTVGYGDYYPVTTYGRMAAAFIMFAGVGIIGALSSILASLLVGGSESEPEETSHRTGTRRNKERISRTPQNTTER
jgi:voltage-gated potassium channel